MSVPVAYLRKSRVTLASPGELSHEAQLAAVRELAATHGDPEPVVLSDWSRSGRHGARRRPGYAEMIRMIESGEASAVYSYSLSRLSRSMRDFAEFADLARRHNVPVRLAKDTMNVTTASGRLNTGVLALVNAFEAEVAQERAQDTIAARRARGDHVGSAPYGFVLRNGKLVKDPKRPIQRVVDAYQKAGTYAGAAKVLNKRKALPPRPTINPKNGESSGWNALAVRRIINRVMPETISTTKRPGRKPRADFLFSGLLVCPCGTTLTGRVSRQKRTYGARDYEYVTYICWRGRYGEHSRPYMVTEAAILPWVKAETARLRLPEIVEMSPAEDRRPAIEARRMRWLEQYADGLIDKAERDRRLDAIAEELVRLDAVSTIVDVPKVDWTWQAPVLNGVLRALFRQIDLDEKLRPVRAEWRFEVS